MEYKLVSDDDGHYYVIPADKDDLFDQIIFYNTTDGVLPEWIIRVNGPHTVVFENWREDI